MHRENLDAGVGSRNQSYARSIWRKLKIKIFCVRAEGDSGEFRTESVYRIESRDNLLVIFRPFKNYTQLGWGSSTPRRLHLARLQREDYLRRSSTDWNSHESTTLGWFIRPISLNVENPLPIGTYHSPALNSLIR